MTEYGRGPSPEPWHPEDPSNGDQGWEGYGGQQHYPQQPQGQQPQYPQQPGYPQQPQQPDQYGYGYDTGQQQGYPQQPYDAGWDTGQRQQHQMQQPQYQDPAYGDPYAGQAHPDPYGAQGGGAYGGQQPDYYATPGAYPPPQPPEHRGPVPQTQQIQQQQEPQSPQQAQQSDWDAQTAEEPEHAFFGGDDPDPARDTPGTRSGGDGDDDDPPRAGRRDSGGRKPKKPRNGMACLIVAGVLVAGVGGVGYYGYTFWQDRFGPAPDFSGAGSDPVEVEIPQGATGAQMGSILKQAGVVKSVDAFVDAMQENPKAGALQAGVYTLKRQMSSKNAVDAMIDPNSLSGLTIPEGYRNVQVYKKIDERLELKPGTTANVAKEEVDDLGLPEWATGQKQLKDPLEGFLFPASYPVSRTAKPEDVLKKMVAKAKGVYTEHDVEGQAAKLGLTSPLQVVTVASLVQAEGITHDDFRKMAEVMYNRLKPGNTETNGMLEFDSTYNYIKNQNDTDLSLNELRKLDHPYNTYYYKGLPPGPIGNPGEEALNGAMDPTSDGWYYFASLDGKTTQFTKTYTEHKKLADEYAELRKGD